MVVVAGSSWQEERRVKGEERVFAWLPPSSLTERLGVCQAPVIIPTWLLCLNNVDVTGQTVANSEPRVSSVCYTTYSSDHAHGSMTEFNMVSHHSNRGTTQ